MTEEQLAKITADLASNETEHESFRRRLKEHDEKLEKQADFLVAMERMSNAIKSVADSVGRVETKVTSIDNRVADLEKEPAEKWKKITWEVLKYIVLALAGAAAGYFLSNLGG